MGATWLSDNICKKLNVFDHQADNTVFWAQYYNSTDLQEDIQALCASLLLAFPEYELRYNTALSASDQNDFFM